MDERARQTSRRLTTNWFRKKSFDRFGDDLTELILSYLPFEEKFRFECLSKVIRNVIFNKENIMRLRGRPDQCSRECPTPVLPMRSRSDGYVISEQMLRSYGPNRFTEMVKKLKYLNRLYISDNFALSEQFLKIIGQYCPIRKLEISDIVLEDFQVFNIAHHLPHLVSIKLIAIKSQSIRFTNILTDKSLNYISQLKSLSSLTLWPNYSVLQWITGEGVQWLLNNCQSLRRLDLRLQNENNIFVLRFALKCIKAFKRKAEKNPRNKYFFDLKFAFVIGVIDYQPIKDAINELPRNLKINFHV